MKVTQSIQALKYGELIHWDATSFLTLHDGYNSQVYHGIIGPTLLQNGCLWLRGVLGGLGRFSEALAGSLLRRRPVDTTVSCPYLLLVATGTAKYASEEREIVAACEKRGLGVLRVYPGKGGGVSSTGPVLPVHSVLRTGDHARALANWSWAVLRGTRHLFSRDPMRRSLFAASILSIRQYFAYVGLARRIAANHGLPRAVLSLCPTAAMSVAIVASLKEAGVLTAGIRTQTTSSHAEHLAINAAILFCKGVHERGVYENLFAGNGPRLENACLLSLPEVYSLEPLPLPDQYVLVLGTAPASGQSDADYWEYNERLFRVAAAAELPIVFKGHGLAADRDDVWLARGGTDSRRCLRISDVRRNRELIDRASLVVSAATTLLYYALLRGTPVILVQSPTDAAIPDEFRGAPLARNTPAEDLGSVRLDWPALRDSARNAQTWFKENYFLEKGPDWILDQLLGEQAGADSSARPGKKAGGDAATT